MASPYHHRHAQNNNKGSSNISDGSSLLGLGFGGTTETTADGGGGGVEDLMQHYLQQCLEFHDEQQKQVPGAPPCDDAAPLFVAPRIQDDVEVKREGEEQSITTEQPKGQAAEEQQQQPAAAAVSSLPEALAKARAVVQTFSPVPPKAGTTTIDSVAAQEAIAKAKAIVQSFQSQSQSHPAVDSKATSLPCDYKNRRDYYVQHCEQVKLRKALMKNFAYIARKADATLQRQLEQVETVKQYEAEVQAKHYEIQKQRQQHHQGIGGQHHYMNMQKKKNVRSKKRKLTEDKQRDDEASLYLSNLPSTIQKELVEQLFGSYGSIRRVHFYKDKQTGELKGDGLVVYQAKEKKLEFLQTICQQVSEVAVF